VGTTNVGSHAPMCHPIYMRCVRGGSLSRIRQASLIRTRGGVPSLSVSFPKIGDDQYSLHINV
jgi:hypothetical protein